MMIQRSPLAVVASRVLIVLGVACLAMTPGCAEPVQSGRRSDSHPAKPDSVAKTLGDQPPTPKTLLSMADILAAQGKDKECEFVLSTCIRQNPGFAPAYNALAELQMRQGRLAEAKAVLSGALRHWPGDPVLLNNLGMCSLIAREYEAALSYFTCAAARVPASEKYRANMATSLGMLGRDAEALALLTQVLSEQQAAHNVEVLKKARQRDSDTAGSRSSG